MEQVPTSTQPPLHEWAIILKKFVDTSSSDDVKLKCLQNLVKNWDKILSHSSSKRFVEAVIPPLATELDQSEPNFIEQTHRHLCRKLIIEIFRRLASYPSTNKNVVILEPPQVSRILSSVFKSVIEVDNEVNVLCSLRVIFALHKYHKPGGLIEETKSFLRLVQAAFLNLHEKLEEVFSHKTSIEPNELVGQGGHLQLLSKVFAVTPIHTKNLTLIPKGTNSLKVLHELPIVTLLLHQVYKELVQTEMDQLIPFIISTVSLHPISTPTNRKVFLEFLAVQIKILSMLGYIIKLPAFQNPVVEHGELITSGFINLLKWVPSEAVSLRRELLTVAGVLIKTQVGFKFINHVSEFFDIDVILGRGWTARRDETVRSLAFKLVAEMMFTLSQCMSVADLIRAVHFSVSQLLDDSNTIGIQTMFVRLLFPLVETMYKKLSGDEMRRGRDFLFQLLEVLLCKLKMVSARSSEFSGTEAQALLKAVFSSFRRISWLIQGRNLEGSQPQIALKAFSAGDADIYVNLLNWGLKVMGVLSASKENVSLMEEKEVWKDFGYIFSSLNVYTFRQVCSASVETIMESLGENTSVHLLIRSLLAQADTSPVFGSILLEYLLKNIEVLGEKVKERSEIFLKLFRAIFATLKLFPVENEAMFKPFFGKIVSKAMTLGKSSKKPLNYFKLLLDLFIVTNGRNYELLHQEFLPLLSNLARDLQRFRNGSPPKEVDELVINLCLSLPARVNNLLPHMSVLMNSVVAALSESSSPSLVIFGLRYLELLVDNIAVDSLVERLQPVQTELMEALWKILRNSDPSSLLSISAFRIVGKFGGINRKGLQVPQKLKCHPITDEGQSVQLQFMDDHPLSVNLPLENIVKVAVKTLHPNNSSGAHYKKQALEILHGVLLSAFPKQDIQALASSLREKIANPALIGAQATLIQGKYNFVFEKALSGWLNAATVKEIQKDVFLSLTPILRQIAVIVLAEEMGHITPNSNGIESYAVFDALFNAFASEEKGLRRVALYSLAVILNGMIHLMSSKEQVFTLPLMGYITDKMCGLCQDSSWRGKMGGCEVITFFLENAPTGWIYANQVRILKALLFLFNDLSGQVYGGVAELARENVTKLIQVVSNNLEERLQEMKRMSVADISRELLKRLTSPASVLREECKRGLELLAKLNGQTVSGLLAPQMAVISGLLPSKILLRNHSISQQLGILDGWIFCLSSNPKCFSLNWTIAEHQSFIVELLVLGETNEERLRRCPSYRVCSSPNFVLLQQGILQILSTLTDLPTAQSHKIISIFFLHLGSTHSELQEAAFQSFKKLMTSTPVPAELQMKTVETVLSQVQFPTVNISIISHFSYLYQLFSNAVPLRIWNPFCQLLHKCLELVVTNARRSPNSFGVHKLDLCVKILECFLLLNDVATQFIPVLIKLCVEAEKALFLGEGNPMRPPLFKFLLKHSPAQFLCFLLPPATSAPQERSRFFLHLLQTEEAQPLRSYLLANPQELLKFINPEENEHSRFVAVKALIILNKFDEQYVYTPDGEKVVDAFELLWMDNRYQDPKNHSQSLKLPIELRTQRWEEGAMIVKHLLRLRSHGSKKHEYGLLFQLLAALCWIPTKQDDFAFLKDFFEKEVSTFDSTWKRDAALHFLNKIYNNWDLEEELKAKIIQFVLIPGFTRSFEEGKGVELINGDKSPVGNIADLLIISMLPIRSGIGDELIIALLQFFSLLVDRAPNLISQPCLKKLEIFAWGFVNLETGEVDPCVKYRAHLLLSHLCAKFTANKQSVLKMFYNLLSSSPEMTEEAKGIANEALDIFIPAILKMEEGLKILFGCTTKMLQGEESGTLNQLVHILRLIVRHWKVYYNGRQLLIGLGKLLEIITRLGLSGSELCHKMVALDVAQVILNWELLTMENVGKKESEEENKLLNSAPIRSLLRFVLQMSCQENTEKRSKVLLNSMLKPDIWLSHLNHLDYGWMKKVLIAFGNFSSSCLERLTFVIGLMSKEAVLRTMGVLREEVISCIATKSQEKGIQVILHKLISQLMHLFPIGEISSDLKQIYNSVFEVISKGMKSFEIGANQDDLVAALMMLQAACGSNPGFIDPFMIRIMGILEKLSRIPPGENQAVPAELLVFIINLVNTKLPVMREEMRNTWVEIVLVNFIDNSKQVKILEVILEMVEEKPGEELLSLKEMEILLVKLMKNVETRFAKEEKLVKKFLNLVLTVYVAENYVKFEDTDLRALLEPAFFRGLCHPRPEMRDKFSQVFDGSIKKQVFERLFYIVSHQNWGAMGAHYWITQCLQLLFGTVLPSSLKIVPKIEEVEPFVKKEQPSPPSSQQDVSELDKLLKCLANTDDSDEKAVADAISKLECAFIKGGLAEPEHPNWNLMLKNCQEKSRLSNVLNIVLTPTIELCHLEPELAESLWISLLPKLWKALSLRQQQTLGNEIPVFLMSGIHLQQQHCSPSALATFFEAVSRFDPPIPIQPSLLFYLGKSHNLWHSSALLLEQLLGNFERIPSELRDSLSELYSELGELDLCAGLWQRAALLPETGAAIALEQKGSFSEAQEMFELAMNKMGSEGASNNSILIGEARFLEEHWLKCSKELNEWDAVQEYTAFGGAGANPLLHLEALWKKADWAAAQKALLIIQEQDGCPKGEKWKLELIQGYISLFSGGGTGSDVQSFADKAQHLCVQEWKGLSKFVSGGQVRVLQGVQQVVELREAACLHQSLQANRFGEVERVVKAWHDRLPTISDDLSHWFDILCWRALNYQHIENQSSQELTAEGGDSADRKLFGVHASVQAICQFGKVARKHGHAEVALEALEKVYELPKVPVNDCFQKLKQQFKCYLQKGRFQDAMEIMEESNLEYFGKETISEYLALKGQLLVKMGEDEKANKAFSASCHLVPELLGKNWALWGEYLENCFISQGKPELGISAITAFLRACQSFSKNEGKARKYIAKVLWVLGSFADENGTDSVLEWCEQIPSIQWLIWIPQLLTMLVEKDGKVASSILNRVGSAFPQALYFPLRTLYLTLKVEQTEKLNKEFAELLGHPSGAAQQIPTIKATPSMWRCSKVMQAQRMNHPVLLSVLEGIAEELSFFRESWQEEQLKQLKTALASCYRIAFQNLKDSILITSLTPEIAGRINKVGLGFQFTQFPQDPWFGWMKAEFEKDFGHLASPQELLDVIQKLLKWIEIFEGNVKALPSLVLCDERSKLLLSFSMDIADVKLPGEFLIPITPHYSVRIARFEAQLDVVVKPGSSGKRLIIRAHNGKVYPYLVANNSEPSEWEGERREERVLQLLRILNNYLGKQKETAKRSMMFMVPKLVAVSPQLRLAEDYPASLSLLEMFKLACSKQGLEADSLVLSYYQKLGDIQGKGEQLTHGALRDIFQGIQQGLVSVDVLKNWATQNFVSASDYWMFRKTFTTQMCLNILAEYAFQLTSLKPEGLNIHPDTGLVNISYFKFDTDASQPPVPFRLTSNLYEFMTENGVNGPLTFGLKALAKCLAYPNYNLEAILRPILKDEILANLKRNEGESSLGWETPMETYDPETVTDLVNNAVSAIMTRLSGITGGKVNELIAAASSVDNLCRMDPSAYPWL